MSTSNILQSSDYSASFNHYVYNEIAHDCVCLDVGCWNGNLGAKLVKSKHCIVDGLDVNTTVLNVAKKRGYRNIFTMDLNASFLEPLKSVSLQYDYIIFADVLEHTINPENILLFFQDYLKPNGKVIISLPNVTFILNRLLLLFGKWNYTEFGTLDKTHLKFFTLQTGIELAKQTGLVPIKIKPYYQFGLKKYLSPLVKILPNLFAYQFLFICQKHE